jgi:hypothetical protein
LRDIVIVWDLPCLWSWRYLFFFPVSGFDQIQRTFAIARVPRWTRSTVL